MRVLSILSHSVAALLVLLACGDDRAADDLFADGERAGSGDAPGLEAGRASFGGYGTSGALGAGFGGAGSSQGGVADPGKGGATGGFAQGGSSMDPGASGSNEGGAGALGGSGAGTGASSGGGASGSAGASPSGGNALGGAAGSGSGGTGGGSAGAAGTGGSAGKANPADCAQLRSKADALLAEAQACDPDAPRSCAGLVTDECGCHVAVNDPDSPEAQSYVKAVERLNERCTVACFAVLCREPADAACLPNIPASRCVARGFTGVRPEL